MDGKGEMFANGAQEEGKHAYSRIAASLQSYVIIRKLLLDTGVLSHDAANAIEVLHGSRVTFQRWWVLRQGRHIFQCAIVPDTQYQGIV